MMKTVLAFAMACAACLVWAPMARAHHSGAAEFDMKKRVELTGVVTKVEWTNPHAHFYMDVKDASGAVTNWNFELASPNVLSRNGWHRNSVKAGDTVTVSGSQAKDASNYAAASAVTFPDGHKLTFLGPEDPAK
jgi:Family of unknown function (DUF6152)